MIIKSKLEVLSQNKGKDYKESLDSMRIISKSISRLSKLSTSLLLITKINNDQYLELSPINFTTLIKSYIESLEELIEMKGLALTLSLSRSRHSMNSILADILISNILSNSIRHNIPNGYIKIHLTEEFLIVENSCEAVDLESMPNLFERLIYKKSENSTGLGLNIVKSICDKNKFDINYSYPKKNEFKLHLQFNKVN